MDLQHVWIVLLFVILTCVPNEGTRFECSVDLCSWENKHMSCNGSVILMQNVTDVRTQFYNERAFMNLQRMCSGLSKCFPTSYCRMQKIVRVSYLCINENQIQKQCPSHAQILTSEEGYIQSPDYPSALSLNRCVWRIIVPKDSYVTLVLLDFQRGELDYSRCNGGLRLTTVNECPQNGFPSRDICRLRDQTSTFNACGDVEINFLPGNRGNKMRFWLSYKVRKINTISTSIEQDNLPSRSMTCPDGYFGDVNSGEMVIPLNPRVLHPQYNSSIYNQTELKASADSNPVMNTDRTEKTVLYVAVAVAIVSLTGLVIVTAICIRQRRFKPNDPHKAEHHVIPHNGTLTRPLPPVLRPNSMVQDCPRLDDGYSVVADEIPYTPNEDNVRSPPYAEVEDHMIDRGQLFRFGRLSANVNKKKSVENIYSELTDGKDKNVYHEISDETFVHSPTICHNDQTQLINQKRSSKILPFGPKQCKRPVSFEGPYASSDVTSNRRSVSKEADNNNRSLSKELSGSLSYKSDSDGSFVIENENFEAYQSAHV